MAGRRNPGGRNATVARPPGERQIKYGTPGLDGSAARPAAAALVHSSHSSHTTPPPPAATRNEGWCNPLPTGWVQGTLRRPSDAASLMAGGCTARRRDACNWQTRFSPTQNRRRLVDCRQDGDFSRRFTGRWFCRQKPVIFLALKGWHRSVNSEEKYGRQSSFQINSQTERFFLFFILFLCHL